MTPRATIQQAIEFLKIHQLRRENAAIYENICKLKDEVADLHNATDDNQHQLDQIRTDLTECHALAVQNSRQFGKGNTEIDHLRAITKELKSSSASMKDGINKQFERLQAQDVQFVNKLNELDKIYTQREKECTTVHETLAQGLKDLQEQLLQKAGKEEVEHMLDHLHQRLQDIGDVRCSQASIESTSRVYDSVEKSNTNAGNCTGTQEDQCNRTKSKSLLIHNDGDTGVQQRMRKSTVPNDLDLDEEAANISYTGHGLNVANRDDELVMLPYGDVAEDLIGQLQKLLSLKQRSHEGLGTYTKRGIRILQQLPSTSEVIVLHILVNGLVKPDQRHDFTGHLNQSSWTWKRFENVIKCQAAVQAKRSDTQKKKSPKSQAPIAEDLSTQILIQASENLEEAAQPATGAIDNVSPSVEEPRPRRSQRLAALSQQQFQTQSRTPLETETQAEALDARVASAAARTWSKQVKTRAKEEPLKDRTGVLPTNIKERTASKRPQQPKTAPNKRQPISADNSADIRDEALPIPQEQLRTPRRTVIDTRPPKPPQETSTVSPSSPLQGKTAKMRFPKPNPKRPGTTRLTRSPYNPQPRLVYGKTNRPLHDIKMSAFDGSIPGQQVGRKNYARGAEQTLPEPPRKKRRLPLPPPPQIPILSTSTEEDARFDRW